MALSSEIIGANHFPHIDLGKRVIKRLLKENRPPIVMQLYASQERGTTFVSNSAAICLVPGNGIREPETPFPLHPARARELVKRIQSVRQELKAETERKNQKKS